MDRDGGEARARGERGAPEQVGHLGVVSSEVHHPRSVRAGAGGQRVEAHLESAHPVLEKRPAGGLEQRGRLRGLPLDAEWVHQDVHPEPEGVLERGGRRDLHRRDVELQREGGGRPVAEPHRELPIVPPGLRPRRDAQLEIEHQRLLRRRARGKHRGVGAAARAMDREERIRREARRAAALRGPGEVHPRLAVDLHPHLAAPGSSQRRDVRGLHLGRGRDVDLEPLALAPGGPETRLSQRLDRLAGAHLGQRRDGDQPGCRGERGGDEDEGQRGHAGACRSGRGRAWRGRAAARPGL